MNDTKKTNNVRIESEETHNLAGMVDYSNGAVISRILYKSDKGNITLFSFDKDQNLSEHSAPYDAIVQIVEGSARLTIGGKDVMAKTGDLVVMPANIPHAVYADKRFKMLLTMIRDKKED